MLDVALPTVHAYEIVEEVKRRAPETRIVLVASIYNRTGYKRRPTSLYGADDYVEQHHIPDALLTKLERLIGPAPRAVELPPAHVMTHEAAEIRDAGGELRWLRPPAARSRVARRERCRHDDLSAPSGWRGSSSPTSRSTTATRSTPPIITATTRELEARLRLDLEEGRLLFDLRVPAEVRRDARLHRRGARRDPPAAAAPGGGAR